MSKSPSLLTKAAACAIFMPSLAAFADVPSVTVDHSFNQYDYTVQTDIDAYIDGGHDGSPRITWTADGNDYTIQRSSNNGSSWEDVTVVTGSDSSYVDSSAKIAKTYIYRLASVSQGGDQFEPDPIETGSASGPITVMRYLAPANADAMFSNGEGGQSWAWNGKSVCLVFDGGLNQKNFIAQGRSAEYYVSGTTQYPILGIDYGEPVYVSYCRTVPRYDSANREHRVNTMVVYGAGQDWANTGVAISGELQQSTGAIASGSGFGWYGMPVDSSTGYRCIYVTGIKDANVTEVEFWGWTAADLSEAAKIDDVTFSVDRTDFINSYAVLTFEGSANGLTVQRRFGEDGEWTDVGTVSDSTFTDETVPYGGKVYYRLSNGESVTSEQSFVRMHLISTDSVTFFTDAPMKADYVKPVSNAFDGNTSTFADLDKDIAKLGVDFGSRSVAVAMVRAFPRAKLEYRLKHSILYGSLKGADEEGATSDKATVLTAEFPEPVTNEWNELSVQVPGYYRSYYFSKTGGEFHGNIAEAEFYGWTLADVDNPPLDFTIGKNNLVDFKPVLTWNAIGRAVEVQRADNAAGPWGTLATTAANESSYVDSTVKRYGLKYFYRLKYGNVTSEVLPFRRLRKLSTDGKAIFTNGVVEYGAKENAFDGNTAADNRAEYDREQLNWTDPKIGVDFDSNDIAVGLVRFYPRHEWTGNTHLSAGAILYGSNRSAADEAADTTLATALTEPTDFVAEVLEWQERAVEHPDYYRTYYYQGCYNANMCEVELYGWFLNDIVRPFKLYIR